ncbi:hypothetical protein ONO84_24790, partial [Salmonella enterica subsp. enterica serovar Virginia]|nr:hypothetical protein [Salmonella enterica subsp. enterica serovar Virginia]
RVGPISEAPSGIVPDGDASVLSGIRAVLCWSYQAINRFKVGDQAKLTNKTRMKRLKGLIISML